LAYYFFFASATGCAVASTVARADFAKTDEDWSWYAVPRYILA
jgi:hypothetical protein